MEFRGTFAAVLHRICNTRLPILYTGHFIFQLIIQLDPPTTVTTLVQVRGRARKQGSHYILVCRSHDQAEELRDLIKREEYMIEAVTETVQLQKDKSAF